MFLNKLTVITTLDNPVLQHILNDLIFSWSNSEEQPQLQALL